MLIVCDSCARHVKKGAEDCLFCGAVLIGRSARPDMGVTRMRALVFGALTAASAAACTPQPTASMYGAPPVPVEPVDAAAPDAPVTPAPIVTAYGVAPMPDPPKRDH